MMDIRNLPDGLDDAEQCDERRKRIEKELGIDLSAAAVDAKKLGHANRKNCEQMWGHVPVPVGLAGPLNVHFSSNEQGDVYLPLATTEGALIASINRGCKATAENGILTGSKLRGMTRSLAFETSNGTSLIDNIKKRSSDWQKVAEATSEHLKLITFDIDEQNGYVFLTIACDTDRAMGMNMTTIAAHAVGKWIAENCDAHLITIAANVDSDKKPSKRTHEKGRGFEASASATITTHIVESVLKTRPENIMTVYKAKIETGSEIAGAMAKNCQSANVVAAIYLATGQDAAHVAEGSLADTVVALIDDGIQISVRHPAILVGTVGGGTTLPAQKSCLDLILRKETKLGRSQQLAEIAGAAVLAGELSLLAALASQDLAQAHKKLGR